MEDLDARLDDPDLAVTPNHVLVLRNAGPIGAPGMPEAGSIPIPKKLAAAGVRDMVRVSDARMSGTAYGTVVLVDEVTLTERRAAWQAPAKPPRGYARLYVESVLQADRGCDFDFLVPEAADDVPALLPDPMP